MISVETQHGAIILRAASTIFLLTWTPAVSVQLYHIKELEPLIDPRSQARKTEDNVQRRKLPHSLFSTIFATEYQSNISQHFQP